MTCPVGPSAAFPFDAVRKRESVLYLYGYVVYWDAFDIQRGLTYCGRYNVDTKQFEFCESYNVAW